MTYKITSLNPFDRGFFGSTLLKQRKFPKNYTPSKLEQDSIDDLNKHFLQKMFMFKKADSKKIQLTQALNNEPVIQDEHTLFHMF